MTSGCVIEDVIKITGISCSELYNIEKKAIKLEFNPIVNFKILATYVKNAIRSRKLNIHIVTGKDIIQKIKRVRYIY